MYKLYTKSENPDSPIRGITHSRESIPMQLHYIKTEKLSEMGRWIAERVDGCYVATLSLHTIECKYKGAISYIPPKRFFAEIIQPYGKKIVTYICRYGTKAAYEKIAQYPRKPGDFNYLSNETFFDINRSLSIEKNLEKFVDKIFSYRRGFLKINNDYFSLTHRRYYKFLCPVCEFLKLKEVFVSDNILLNCPNCGASMDRCKNPEVYLIPRNNKKYAVEIDGQLKGFLTEDSIFKVFSRIQNMYPDLNKSESIDIKLIDDRRAAQIVKEMVTLS